MDTRVGLVLCAALLALSCSEDRLVAATCQDDSHCESGFLCEDHACVPAETKRCTNVLDGKPILQPAPYLVAFGDLDVAEASATVTLHNIGNCALTVFEASLASKKTDGPFGCGLCSERMPVEIFPGRSHDFTVSFKNPGVGEFNDDVVVLSDDKEFPELRIPLHANFLGIPDLRVSPSPADFGYVAQGRASKKALQITNQGTGTAVVSVTSVALDPPDTQDFEIGKLEAELPLSLAPLKVDKNAVIPFEVTYHPRSSAKHAADLVVQSNKGEVRVKLSGNAETPPKLDFNPASIELGQVPLGATNFQTLTLLNSGGSPLIVQYVWGGTKTNTDLFALPAVVPNVAPGAHVDMQVGVTATAVGPITGLLVLSTNDPSKPSVTIPVSAEGVAGPGPQVVKLEMTYDNGSDTAFDNDLRNVDMTLEHPYGYVCNKQYPNPTNWGSYGNPSWIAFGPKEEPERIVLADAKSDGTWRVMVTYPEDCASIPTGLTAGLLGISVDALVTYLTGGIGLVDGKDVSEIIQKTCISHQASNVTVRAFVNGTVVAEKTANLSRKGDAKYVMDLVRANGAFTAK